MAEEATVETDHQAVMGLLRHYTMEILVIAIEIRLKGRGGKGKGEKEEEGTECHRRLRQGYRAIQVDINHQEVVLMGMAIREGGRDRPIVAIEGSHDKISMHEIELQCHPHNPDLAHEHANV